MTYAVIMVRSRIGIRPDIKYTLDSFRLNRINHCVLVPEDVHHKGMLYKVKDYVTWGEIDPETLRLLVGKRGRAVGGEELSESIVRKATPYKSVDELCAALAKGDAAMKKFPGLKPLFRLSPPRKGWKGIKRSHRIGGALGYRGDTINELIRRML